MGVPQVRDLLSRRPVHQWPIALRYAKSACCPRSDLIPPPFFLGGSRYYQALALNHVGGDDNTEKARQAAHSLVVKDDTSMRAKILLGQIHTTLMMKEFDRALAVAANYRGS